MRNNLRGYLLRAYLLRAYLQKMGALRNLLHGAALLFMLMMPLAIEPGYTANWSSNWHLFFSGVLPATAPLVVIVIAFDIMMSRIRQADADEADRQRYSLIMRTHLIVGGALLAAWLAVFLPALI